MDWSWQHVNNLAPWFAAIGSWFAAIATWYTARTAIKLSRQADKQRIDASIDIGSKYPRFDDLASDVIVTITNVGKTPLAVMGVYWNKGSFSFEDYPILPSFNDPMRLNSSTTFPVTLSQSETAQVFILQEEFGHDFIDSRASLLEAFLAIKLMKIRVELAGGFYVLISPSQKVKRFLFEKYFVKASRWRWLCNYL